MTFEEIKEAYECEREKERKNILSHLEKNKFEVIKGGTAGKGKKNYTAGNSIKEYNLRNWKYVEGYYNQAWYCISLQVFDYDPNSHNFHVLMDRIGVYKYSGTSEKKYRKYNPFHAFSRMVITDFELPLSDTDLDELVKFIKELPVV